MNRRAVETQARVCVAWIRRCLWEVMVNARPADRLLQGLFRDHRELGSRDRRLLRDTVFHVFRWWGLIRPYAPPVYLDWLREAEPGDEFPGDATADDLEAGRWSQLLIAAWMAAVENAFQLPPAVGVWARWSGVPREAVDHLLPGNDLHLRCERVRRVLSVPTDAPPESVATDLRCFLPDWAYGFLPATTDSEQIVGWLQLRPPVWIRRQGVTHDQLLAALTEDGLEPRRHPALDTAYCLGHPEPDLYRTGAFREGWFEIQDLASQIIGYVCRAEAGQRWWDACAGGGGKSLQLAADMDGRGTVVATDIREHKLDDLRRRARRAGLHNIQTRSWDGRKPPGKAGAFDGVLVDAPCSCSGTWRRNPDGRWRVRPEDVAELAAVQGRILDAAAPGVRPGGRLVYATCSMFELENHGVVRRFLERHPEFRLGTLRNPILRDSQDEPLQVWPWDGDCDAMFVACLERERRDLE